jgi:hypothetical protein
MHPLAPTTTSCRYAAESAAVRRRRCPNRRRRRGPPRSRFPGTWASRRATVGRARRDRLRSSAASAPSSRDRG